MYLQTSVQYLKGIGPKRAELLKKNNLGTILQLLDHYPRRYLDRSTIMTLNNLMVDKEVTVVGKIEAMGIRRGRKPVFYLVISDGKGLLEALWFSRSGWYKKIFNIGDWISLSGKIAYYRGYQIIHPDFDKLNSDDFNSMIHTGKIIPLYPGSESFKNAGINSYTFRRIMAQVLECCLDQVEEFLPEKIIQQYDFLNRAQAYRQIHFPESQDLLQRSILRFKYEEFLLLQLMLVMLKFHNKHRETGIAFEKSSVHLEQLYNKLPFSMTTAQKRVVKEIRSDMKLPHPMNRLLQGDVGSGKTLVALMAMLIAIDNGYQAALMVPTEILAEQHYLNLKKVLAEMRIPLSLLTGNTSKKDRALLNEKLAQKKSHIIIGTHALFQEKVSLPNLGLVIIDEQHRFGVLQRAALVKKGIHADVLVMTATPIPRTLALTVYGNLEVSVIDEMPPKRGLVRTIWRFDDKAGEVYAYIKKQIELDERAFIIYPLVQESEKLDLKAASESFENLKKTVFKGYPMALIHGRLKQDEKTRIMREFLAGTIKILVSTTVVEVGVDIPEATIMVIQHSERFGLSQLHQLRGRVGRGQKHSCCFLMTPHNIGTSAEERMRIMVNTTDGFKIAEEDLRIRGWGDLCGTKQHGLPYFKIADPVNDQSILISARQDAGEIVAQDPQLQRDLNIQLRNKLKEKYQAQYHLVKIG
jgi:ATP-dependent DNA helicase RecG